MQKLGVYSFFCIAILACALYAKAKLSSLARCDTWERELLKDDLGHTVWLDEETCSGFVNGTTVAIALSKAGDKKTTFFSYEDVSWNAAYYGQTTPHVKWTAPNHLEVSIGAVTNIEQKRNRVGDIVVSYNISHVL